MAKKKAISFHFTAPPSHFPWAKAIAQLNKDFETNEAIKERVRKELTEQQAKRKRRSI